MPVMEKGETRGVSRGHICKASVVALAPFPAPGSARVRSVAGWGLEQVLGYRQAGLATADWPALPGWTVM